MSATDVDYDPASHADIAAADAARVARRKGAR